MKNWRTTIEIFFEKIGLHIYSNPLRYIFIILFFSILLFSYLPTIKVNMSPQASLHKTDPVLVEYKQFLEKYGGDTNIIIAIKSENIFSYDFLSRLKKLHHLLEDNVPSVNQVKSLVNARNIRGEKNEVIIEGLLDKWPQSKSELQQTRALALKNPFYKDLYISENGKMTSIILEASAYSPEKKDEYEIFFSKDNKTESPLISNEENHARITALNTIIEQFDSPDFKIYVTGPPIVLEEMTQSIKSNMKRFIILSFWVIILVLYMIFRRISGILLPLSIVILTVLLTFSFMAFFQTPITVTSQIFPTFLMVVGISDSIHILTIFYKKLGHYQDKKRAIIEALGHSGLAITLTTLTTAVALSAFALSDIAIISQLSVYTTIGVFIALFLTIVLLPALIAILPIKGNHISSSKEKPTDDLLDSLFDHMTIIISRHASKILYGFLILSFAGLILAFQLKISHFPLKWLPADNALRVSTALIDKEMKGSVSLEILIETNIQNKVNSADFAHLVEKFVANVNKIHIDNYHPGKAIAYTDIVKEINKALHNNDKDFYRVPESNQLIAQELLLFESSGQNDLNKFVDYAYSTARISIQLPRSDAVNYIIIIEKIKEYLATTFASQYSVVITGGAPLVGQVVLSIIDEALSNYVVAYGFIIVMMILLFGNIQIGLISMIPNIFPVLIGLGCMALLHIPIDVMTILIGTIAVGLSVDDTIHFMHNFKRYYDKTKDIEMSIRLTLQTAGRAMLFTSLILSLGFAVFTFASMQNIVNFGLILAIIAIMAVIADIILAPALMVIYYRKREQGK